MADSSDVENGLVDIIATALYPDGPASCSAVGPSCKIFPGWPVSATLEQDLKDGITCVSVYPVPSSGGDVGQPFLTEDTIVKPAVHGLSAAVGNQTITFTGTPSPDEYATIVVAGAGYTYLTQVGDAAAQVASGLAAALAADFPGTTAPGASVHVNTPRSVLVRLGAPVTLATRIHRQRQQFRIVIWSPTPEDRTSVARFVDVVLKRNLVFRVEDTTQVLLTYQGTNPSDIYEQTAGYRRDLIFNATYDTLDTVTAYEITSVGFDAVIVPTIGPLLPSPAP